MKVNVALDQLVTIDSYELTARLASENSDDQAEFLNQFFENLKERCGDQFHFESQLGFISQDLNKKSIEALKTIIYMIEEN